MKKLSRRKILLHRKSLRGFTLLETVIAGSLLSILLGSSVLALQRGLELQRWVMVKGDLNSRASRGLNRVSRKLIGAGFNSISPDLTTPVGADTVWSSTLDIQLGADWSDDILVWGDTSQIALELSNSEIDNGIDDNNNGLIDEQVVVLLINPGLADEQRVVLVNGVSEYLEGETFNGLDDNGNGLVDETGLCFSLDGELLSVMLSVERIGPDGTTIVRTQETTIGLRN